jgi:hypothetical protein
MYKFIQYYHTEAESKEKHGVFMGPYAGVDYNLTWARTFKCLWGPGIDSKERIPSAYVAWRAGTITLFLFGS